MVAEEVPMDWVFGGLFHVFSKVGSLTLYKAFRCYYIICFLLFWVLSPAEPAVFADNFGST